jgi:hypothetical protein
MNEDEGEMIQMKLGTKGGLKKSRTTPSSAIAVRVKLWGDGQYPIVLVGLSISQPCKGGS